MKAKICLYILLGMSSTYAQQFIENRGQVHDQLNQTNNTVKFLAPLSGMNLELKEDGFSYDIYRLDSSISTVYKETNTCRFIFNRIDVQLIGCNKDAQIIPSKHIDSHLNYYNLPHNKNGVTGITQYQKIAYVNIYPHIDLVFEILEVGNVKYNFVLHPGATLSDIKMKFTGFNSADLKEKNLIMQVDHGILTENIPASYWLEDHTPVDVNYQMIEYSGSSMLIGFSDHPDKISRTMIIDPVPDLDWATYYGGSSTDDASSVETDSLGNVYLAGTTNSMNNIATVGVHQETLDVVEDAYVAKLNIDGFRLWATYYGGDIFDLGCHVTVDHNGYVILAGATNSTNGISTPGSHQPSLGGGQDAFLVKFTPAGVREWGTYYGGTMDEFTASGTENNSFVTVDIFNNIYLMGVSLSPDNIATPGAYQEFHPGGGIDLYLAKFNTMGVRQWGTYYGAHYYDDAGGVETDSHGNIYISGATPNTDSISTPGSYQPSNAGQGDAYVVKFDTSGSRIWASYFGGPLNETIEDLTVDKNDAVYLTGLTISTSGISTPGCYQPTFTGSQSPYIAKFDSAGNREWGTYYGNPGGVLIYAIDADKYGFFYATGTTSTNHSLATLGAYQTNFSGGGNAVFVTKFDIAGNRIWCTYYKGNQNTIAYDISAYGNGNAYVGGKTSSVSGIATTGALQETYGGGTYDGFVARFSDCVRPSIHFSVSNISCHGDSNGIATAYVNGTASPFITLWDNMVDSITIDSLVAGIYNFIAIDTNGCYRSKDTIISEPSIITPNLAILSPSCYGSNDGILSASPIGGVPPFQISWSTGDTTATVYHLMAGIYTVMISDSSSCVISDTVIVTQPLSLELTLTADSVTCDGFADGNAFAAIIGGTSPYHLNWNTGDSTNAIYGLGPGVYTIIVTDSNNCIIADSILVSEPFPLALTFATSPDNGICNGEAQIQMTGGTSPYAFAWSNSDTDSIASNLCSGWIQIVVTDANGCTISDSTEIVSTANIESTTNPISVSVYPNPTDGPVFIQIQPANEIFYTLYDITGRLILQGNYTSPESINLSYFQPGTYVLTLSTFNCSFKQIRVIKK